MIRSRAETGYRFNPETDLIFMRGMHKFVLEMELAFEFKVEVKDVGTTYERIAFEGLTVLDDEWQIKLTLHGPTASNFTFYDSPYLSDFLRGNGGWTFTGYRSATITINSQTHNSNHSQYSKPSGALLTTPYGMIMEVFCYLIAGGYMSYYLDNVEIELKRFDDKRREWVDYPVKLAVEHTVTMMPLSIVVNRVPTYRTPAQPAVDRNKIIVNEGGLQQNVFDDFVFNVVNRTVDGITLPVRLSWQPILGDGDILQTRAPWYSFVVNPDVVYDPNWQWLKLYRGFGYRHYAAPVIDLYVREINDLGHELHWMYKWDPADWRGATAIVGGTISYEKKPPPSDVYTRPRHISRISVYSTQLGLSVDLKPQDAWVR